MIGAIGHCGERAESARSGSVCVAPPLLRNKVAPPCPLVACCLSRCCLGLGLSREMSCCPVFVLFLLVIDRWIHCTRSAIRCCRCKVRVHLPVCVCSLCLRYGAVPDPAGRESVSHSLSWVILRRISASLLMCVHLLVTKVVLCPDKGWMPKPHTSSGSFRSPGCLYLALVVGGVNRCRLFRVTHLCDSYIILLSTTSSCFPCYNVLCM